MGQRRRAASLVLIPVPGPFRQTDPAPLEISYITKHMSKRAWVSERAWAGGTGQRHHWEYQDEIRSAPSKEVVLKKGLEKGARPDLSDHTDVFTR